MIGERDELIQLFQNLIHNAIKYGKSGGHVWVTIAPGAGLRRPWRRLDARDQPCATTAKASRRMRSRV